MAPAGDPDKKATRDPVEVCLRNFVFIYELYLFSLAMTTRKSSTAAPEPHMDYLGRRTGAADRQQ
jgi:hypothetical protein